MQRTHVMLDLETLATDPGGVILSYGAVKFTATEIVDRIHVGITIQSCLQSGLFVDGGTIEWWLHPDRQEAREELAKLDPKWDLETALHGLDEWIAQTPEDERGDVWGNGVAMDNVMTLEAFRRKGLPRPWTYKQDSCYRTIKKFAPAEIKEKVLWSGVAHSAVDDAEWQARHLQIMMKELGLDL